MKAYVGDTVDDKPHKRNSVRLAIRKVKEPPREMENISRDPTFGDFVTIRTERSMQDVTVARLQSTRVQTPFSPLF
jgi:hypothetical protein